MRYPRMAPCALLGYDAQVPIESKSEFQIG
jgi:hypothetical protein